MSEPVSQSFSFGSSEVSVIRRELKRNGQPVALSSRAFDILLSLASCAGRVVSKDELMERVWPGRLVEESTLESLISILRRALGADRDAIRTVAGRGYQFITRTAAPDAPAAARGVALPASRTPLIGRETALDELEDMARTCRLITLVGAGGIGKTRLAVEIARRLADRFPDRVCMAELAPVSQATFVSVTIATALGLVPADGNWSTTRIAEVLNSRRVLLVVDNCEHLIDECAAVIDTLLRAASSIQIIATSREALRTEGEQVFRVASLDAPDPATESVTALMASGALRLFDARLDPEDLAASLDASSVALKAGIGRRLDGIPLAIELAAARVPVFGIAGVAERLELLFEAQPRGAAVGEPRQETLGAMLDWSYALLSPEEQTIFARLSVFADVFSLDSAQAVAGTPDLPPSVVFDCVLNLVSKSLIASNTGGLRATYRMLEMTRAYARQKLAERAEVQHFSRRHAEHFCARFQAAEADWQTALTVDWIARFEAHLEDLRVALSWSFAPDGDVGLGVDLTAAALPYWLERSLVGECLASVSRALLHVETDGAGHQRSAMKLYAARGKSLLYEGAVVETERAFNHALEIADALGDDEHQLTAIWGLWAFTYLNGPYGRSLELAHRFSAIAAARQDRADQSIADRMLGMSYLNTGELNQARIRLESMIVRYEAPVTRSHLIRFAFDQKAAALCALAFVLWLQGCPGESARVALDAAQRADEIDHAATRWYVLMMCTCPMSLLMDGVESLVPPAAAVIDVARAHGMPGWESRGQFWQGLTLLAQGDAQAYATRVTPALRELGEVRHASYLTGFSSALCEQLARHGAQAEALRVIGIAVERARQMGDDASLAEHLRVQGELILLEGAPDAEVKAEQRFTDSLEAARSIDARAWELRAATSLGRLWSQQGKPGAAKALLAPVYERFSDGFGTVDLRAAADLLASLLD
jgi:predicted ATPase/DNA-binding winged helix-turn-helix (wHTH) protein